jgi:hypothetical protein
MTIVTKQAIPARCAGVWLRAATQRLKVAS